MNSENSLMSQFEQKCLNFAAQQQAVGISLQNFKQKFVFNQNSGPDAFYLDVNTLSPSQIIGMNKKQQNICTLLMTQLLFKAGQMLKLPVSTTIVALNIALYYYTRKTFLDYDFRQICMGSMFLACKSEQTLRRSYQVASTFDYIFKMYEGIKNVRHLELNSNEYNKMKEKVLKTQNQILFELGFQVYKLFDIPHRYIGGLLASFNRHKNCNEIAQYAWTFLNDIYRTKAPIYFPGQVIGSAAVFMALKKLNIPSTQKPWWILMQTKFSHIVDIMLLTNQMYEMTSSSKIDFNQIEQILENIGRKQFKTQNVFPVPYYRKISLEQQGKVKRSIVQKIEKNEQVVLEQNTYCKQEKYEDKKSKKEKKKNKKKNKYRDRSRSHSQNNNKKKGKYQNDDETPKIQRNIKIDIEPQRKESLGSVNAEKIHSEQLNINQSLNVNKKQISAKSTILDAKAMLSKFSVQIKKIEVKNDVNLSNQLKNSPSQNSNQIPNQVQKKTHKQQQKDKQSSSSQQDQMLAQLIAIKKKNFQKKQQQKL